MAPIVGITTDLIEVNGTRRAAAAVAYALRVAESGGVPVLLPPLAARVGDYGRVCDAFVFTGGDDPRTEPFGEPTHPKTTPVHPERQASETALLRLLEAEYRDKPVLGVCLGMQMMALVAGGRLNQHMPETMPDAARHWGAEHEVVPVDGGSGRAERPAPSARVMIAAGVVHSHHRQCVTDSGRLVVLARSPDGVIEAVGDPGRRFYVGVQWHPERTDEPAVGVEVFRALVGASRPSAPVSMRSAMMS